MPTVDVSERTYRRLLSRAQRFEDTAEDVITRLLGSAEASAAPAAPARRASPGSILPEREYWLPLLATIAEAGGSMPANDAIEAVGLRLAVRFTEHDREPQKLGEVRWRNRARFARLRMKESGLLKADSPRGIWEITDRGREYLRSG